MSIKVIGIGLDGLVGLGEQAREKIAQATILVGSKRHLSYVVQSTVPHLILDDFLAVTEKIATLLDEGEEIAILVSGDPLFFGLGRLLLERFPSDQISFYPYLTSIQLAFSRIKQPWQDAQIISIHGRSFEPLITALQQGREKIAILTDPQNSPCAIAKLYLQLDLPIDYQFWVCANLGDPDSERIWSFQKTEIDGLLESEFPSLSVLILLRQERVIQGAKFPLFGLQDEVFHSFSDRPGLMTKREIRIQILGELELFPGQIIWDIGAGTGSVSLEIARLCPTSTVYAIEKTAIGITLIEQNLKTFSVTNVQTVYGSAPAILEGLPAPDRIFIGGSGGKLRDILSYSRKQLTPNGRIVLALATLEHLQEAVTWFKEQQWRYHLLQVQISRSVSFAELTRFLPLNPITLVSASNRPYSKF